MRGVRGTLVEQAIRRRAPPPTLRDLPALPEALTRAILDGDCVAFVGGGFSAAAGLPGWGALLARVGRTGSLARDARAHLAALVARGSAHALDQAAQLLQDELGRSRFLARVARALEPRPTRQILRRLWYLLRIPFRAILTTNFDPVLPGALPGPDSYSDVLRNEPRRWWDEAFWSEPDARHVVKLHGDFAGGRQARAVVLTRRDYRRRLYDTSTYTTFLRATLATTTVLYLGFSFEDAYLTELRSEVLALFGRPDARDPHAYAIRNDVSRRTADQFLRHEGIELLSFAGGPGFVGFDRYLEALYRATNPLPRFARLLCAIRLLWVDPRGTRNRKGLEFLERAARLAVRPLAVERVDSAEEALRRLAHPGPGPFDLVIGHWGRGAHTALRLLEGIRAADLRVPVAVFGAPAPDRARRALGLGATGYFHDWRGLLQEIERVAAAIGGA